MRIKILNTQKENEINRELEKLEEREKRDISSVTFFKNKSMILHYPKQKIPKEITDEIKSLRRDYEKLESTHKRNETKNGN